MKTRRLGTNGPEVCAIGFGAMSFGNFFGPTDEKTSHDTLAACIDHGIDFIDTANVYGMGISETYIGNFIKDHPNKFKIATKGGITRNPNKRNNNEAAHLTEALDASLERLGVDYVDLYYVHRRDPDIPIADMVGTLKGFIDAGKIGGYGLSEISPTTLKWAHAEHPCMAVQNEYSLWTRQPELGLIRTCAELGVSFVPFSPLARGLFGETYPDFGSFTENDFRTRIPRFQEPNLSKNLAVIDQFKQFCLDNGWTVSATALAWCLTQGDHLIPIPGTRTRKHLQEWLGALDIKLTPDQLAEIEKIMPIGWAWGDRYGPAQWTTNEHYC